MSHKIRGIAGTKNGIRTRAAPPSSLMLIRKKNTRSGRSKTQGIRATPKSLNLIERHRMLIRAIPIEATTIWKERESMDGARMRVQGIFSKEFPKLSSLRARAMNWMTPHTVRTVKQMAAT